MKIYIISLLLLLPACGRKQKNIFDFVEKPKPKEKIETLALPAVRTITITNYRNDTVKIEWNDLSATFDHPTLKFLGYHLYRFNKNAFIPNKPVHAGFLKENFYIETISAPQKNVVRFVVRALFTHKHGIIAGPASKIVGIK